MARRDWHSGRNTPEWYANYDCIFGEDTPWRQRNLKPPTEEEIREQELAERQRRSVAIEGQESLDRYDRRRRENKDAVERERLRQAFPFCPYLREGER